MSAPQKSKASKLGSKITSSTVDLPRFTTPSQKHVLDFFYQNEVVKRMYAEHVIAMMTEWMKGTIKTYPAHLNTASDICDFVFKHRQVKVNSADTLADCFLSLAIMPTPLEAKRKRENNDAGSGDVKLSKKQAAKAVAKKIEATPTPAGAQQPGQFNIKIRPKRRIEFSVTSVPTFLSFFPSAKVATFSSKGGLHDITCGICKEIGFFTSKDPEGKVRSLDLGQKAWIAVLHDIVDSTGHVVDGMSHKLLELTREKIVPSPSVQTEPDSVEMTEDGKSKTLWSDVSPGE